jgi:hypothetical protein
VESYNVQTGCFSFGNGENVVHVDFGLEDILYITGLPIDGMPMSGNIDKDSVQVVETHLALEKSVAEDLLSICGVDPDKIVAHFDSSSIRSTVDAGIRAKAFVFYTTIY